MKSIVLNRRAVLKGLGGLSLGLPMLEAMLPRSAFAAAPLPQRYVMTFMGFPNGPPSALTPTSTGTQYNLTHQLMPLQNVKADVSVITGLSLPQTGAGNWGDTFKAPGGAFHGSTLGPIVSGTSARPGAGPGQHGIAIPNGVTSDQVVADVLSKGAALRSLELRVQPTAYAENDDTYGCISYRIGNNGQLVANSPYFSPQLAWQNLFASFSGGGDSAAAAAFKDTVAKRKSVLDVVNARTARLLGRVGADDRKRLERHFDEVRDLEKRVVGVTPPPESAQCTGMADPGKDSNINLNSYGSYSNEDERGRIMADLVHMAFTCDLTRVATICYTFQQSFMSAPPGGKTDLHALGHGGDPTAECVGWHMKQFAYLVQKLRETPELAADGTMKSVLDNSVLMLLPEAGWAKSYPDPHSGDNMMGIIAGRAGGLKMGQHLAVNDEHPCKLLLTGMKAVGVAPQTLGEVSGTLAGLL